MIPVTQNWKKCTRLLSMASLDDTLQKEIKALKCQTLSAMVHVQILIWNIDTMYNISTGSHNYCIAGNFRGC